VIYSLTEELSSILTEFYQRWFALHPLAQDYRWYANPEESKVQIYDQHPDTAHRLPSITVKSLLGTTMECSMGQMGERLESGAGAELGEVLTGWYDPRVQYQIESTHDADVRRIADLLTVANIRNTQFDIPKETNGNCILQRPILRPDGQGKRSITHNRVVKYLTLGQTWKVTWTDERIFEDTFEAYTQTRTILDS
jgi:hypothetical protein